MPKEKEPWKPESLERDGKVRIPDSAEEMEEYWPKNPPSIKKSPASPKPLEDKSEAEKIRQARLDADFAEKMRRKTENRSL